MNEFGFCRDTYNVLHLRVAVDDCTTCAELDYESAPMSFWIKPASTVSIVQSTKVTAEKSNDRRLSTPGSSYHKSRSPTETNRYVTSQNVTAARDKYGVCVRALDGDQDMYATGLCERVANCYWEEPQESLKRARRYTDAHYEANERAARDYMKSIVLAYATLGFILAIAVFVGCTKFAVRRWVTTPL